jgi:hypothetical protein
MEEPIRFYPRRFFTFVKEVAQNRHFWAYHVTK